MKQVSLESASAVYDCAQRAQIEVHHVDHAEFQRFCISLSKFERFLGESAKDDYWKKFLRPLKQYRFEMSSTPLPFKHLLYQFPDFLERQQTLLSRCSLIYPRFANTARDLVDSLLAVVDSYSNPILTTCINIVGSGGSDVAILLKEPRFILAVERVLKDERRIGSVEVITARQLTSHLCYSKLIIIGPVRWYGEHVFQSPRAHHLHVVKYRWIGDSNPSNRVFTGSVTSWDAAWIDRGRIASPGTKEGAISSDNSLDAEEFLLSVDWDGILRMMSARPVANSSRADEGEEYVSALLIQLEGEIMVPLDADESARATILMLTQEEADPVRRIPVADLEPGMFLLVRTEGGGEYIVPVADRILSEHSIRARKAQREWKDRLRGKVKEADIHQIVHELKRLGSRRANHSNVRNWMSYRSIKTEDPKDFRSVMKLIGLDDKFDEYWKTMTLIDRAHRRAGQVIRKQLLTEVRSADLQKLQKLGRMDFELSGVAGGNLTAFRIQNVHPQTVEINVEKLGRLFEIDG